MVNRKTSAPWYLLYASAAKQTPINRAEVQLFFSVKVLKHHKKSAVKSISGPSGTAIKPYSCKIGIAAEISRNSAPSRTVGVSGQMIRHRAYR